MHALPQEQVCELCCFRKYPYLPQKILPLGSFLGGVGGGGGGEGEELGSGIRNSQRDLRYCMES